MRHGTVAAKLSDLAATCRANHVLFDNDVLDVGLVDASAFPMSEALLELGELCGSLKRRAGLVACKLLVRIWIAKDTQV